MAVLAVWAVLLAVACQSSDDGLTKNETPPETTFIGRWKYSSEAVDMECNGPKLDKGQQPRRPVEFVDREGTVFLEFETCKVPLVVSGSVASSDATAGCPWVDGISVTVSAVRAELRSADQARLITETQILGKHPQAPDKVFDCSITSNGTITRVETDPSSP